MALLRDDHSTSHRKERKKENATRRIEFHGIAEAVLSLKIGCYFVLSGSFLTIWRKSDCSFFLYFLVTQHQAQRFAQVLLVSAAADGSINAWTLDGMKLTCSL